MVNAMKKPSRLRAGFSLMESMISLFILTLVVGAIFQQVRRTQANYRIESQKLDLSQEDREFIDQFTRDLHQAGYPSPASLNIDNLNAVIDPAGGNPNLVSAGITNISQTSLTMEGDLDGSGIVRVVTYTLSAGAGCPAARPCVLRAVQLKGAAAAGTPYVEVQNVVANSATFTAFDATGNPVGLPQTLNANATTSDNSYKNLRKIKSVTVSLTLQIQAVRDVNGGAPPQLTMTGTARLPNN
jgi:Tfp pilus assembly protein PilW